ncbi:MAG: pilus assembly protein TadG-related protein, partial [Phycisphaerae bacterium]
MLASRKRSNRSVRRATVIIQTVVFGGAVGLGVAALAIDTGLMYGARQELQSAADAAALAAASQLGSTSNLETLAKAEGAKYANLNAIMGDAADLVESDVVFGHAVMNGEKFDFQPETLPYDAVRVTLRRDATVADGPVSLLFGKTFGLDGATMEASATAMLTPRDIALVIDLSGSMNDDSELRHYTDFPSGSGGTREGVQINLKDVWLALPVGKGNAGVGNGIDPAPPGNPNSQNDQPGTGPGSPQNAGGNPNPGAEPQGGNPGPGGPRWGWMTGFGNDIVLGSYSPVGDPGLYYIPRGVTTTDPDVIENLTEAGYSEEERSAL